jgi:hypothetical protein
MSEHTNAPAPANASTLAQKILAIQQSVGIVRKRGFNKEHNYKFLQIEDAVLAVNRLLAKEKLILTPQLSAKPDGLPHWEITPHTGGKGYIAKIILNWFLEDVETGQSRSYAIPGEGYDTTDKGTAKAITASRKQAIIVIFQLAVGFDNEAQSPSADREDAKAAAKGVADRKIAEAAGKGSQTAIEALSQVEPERKVMISRPQEHNGNYIVVTGYIAVPQLERFFDDTGSKRFKTAKDAVPYWRVPSEYEKGLIALCQKLNLEVEG